MNTLYFYVYTCCIRYIYIQCRQRKNTTLATADVTYITYVYHMCICVII